MNGFLRNVLTHLPSHLCISLLTMAVTISNQLIFIILFCIAYSIFSISSGMAQPLIDTIIMDAITPEVEHYIYKVSYWLTNVAVACGAFIGEQCIV